MPPRPYRLRFLYCGQWKVRTPVRLGPGQTHSASRRPARPERGELPQCEPDLGGRKTWWWVGGPNRTELAYGSDSLLGRTRWEDRNASCCQCRSDAIWLHENCHGESWFKVVRRPASRHQRRRHVATNVSLTRGRTGRRGDRWSRSNARPAGRGISKGRAGHRRVNRAQSPACREAHRRSDD